MKEYDLVELYRQLMVDYERAPKVYVYSLDDCDDYYCEQPPKRWSGKRKKRARKQ